MPTTASFDCHPLQQPPKYQQLFRPLGGSHQAVASKLTDSSKFKVTVKSDTDIPAIVFFFFLFCFVLFILFCSFSFYLIFYLLFFFFFFFFFFFVNVLLKYYTVKYIKTNIFSYPAQIIESGRFDYN